MLSVMTAGEYVLNASQDKRERLVRLVRMHANKREEVKEIRAGDIGAVVGLKLTMTGDTLCLGSHPIVLESMKFPEPVVNVALEADAKGDNEKLFASLRRLAMEDPTFKFKVDEETGQTIVSGMGELHLEILVDRLLREFKVGARVGRPQVAYRETVLRTAEAEAKYVKQTGGHGQYGHVVLRVEPLAREMAAHLCGGSLSAPVETEHLSFMYRTLPHLRDRLRFVWGVAVEPCRDDWTGCPLPPACVGLYAVVRPARLCWVALQRRLARRAR